MENTVSETVTSVPLGTACAERAGSNRGTQHKFEGTSCCQQTSLEAGDSPSSAIELIEGRARVLGLQLSHAGHGVATPERRGA